LSVSSDALLLSSAFLVPGALVLASMKPYLGFLTARGSIADDVHKTPPTKVPFPAGPLLFGGAALGEGIAYAFTGSLVPVAVILAAAVAFTVGLVDDLYVMGPRTKPLLLVLAGLPVAGLAILSSDVYDPRIVFPLLGSTSSHFTIYTLLTIAAFPVVANAFNMMDSFNGEISGFSALTSVTLLAATAMKAFYSPGGWEPRVASVLPMVAVSFAFYAYNRYPSRAFDGDSGALMLGAMYAALAVTCGVEIAAIVAILPAILNSFYVLSSLRGFVERRKVKVRPTTLGEGGVLRASTERSAPITLARLLLLQGPMGERDLVSSILALTAVACLLSIVTSLLTWVL
jgi:UDP-N-acetylmuramyl pentapeptide phosphotransferase/UDP-N-acetylglucosamine-1-phosphate transferase